MVKQAKPLTPRAEALIAEIKRVADKLDLTPRYVSSLIGYGGSYYTRLVNGGRVWDETDVHIRGLLAALERDFGKRSNRGRKPTAADSVTPAAAAG